MKQMKFKEINRSWRENFKKEDYDKNQEENWITKKWNIPSKIDDINYNLNC